MLSITGNTDSSEIMDDNVKSRKNDWLNSSQNEIKLGKPILISKKRVYYEGPWENGLPEGFGKESYLNGNLRYMGYFKEGEYCGENVMIYDRGGKQEYKGGIFRGKYQGEGTLNELDRCLYIGGFKNGVYEGKGTEFYHNRHKKYEGTWKGGMIIYGYEYDRKGMPVYKGGFQSNMHDGIGEVLTSEFKISRTQNFKTMNNYSKGKVVGYFFENGKIKGRKYKGFGVSYADDNGIGLKYVDYKENYSQVSHLYGRRKSYMSETGFGLGESSCDVSDMTEFSYGKFC